MKSVYIETSIPSYMTDRPSRDVRVSVWQIIFILIGGFLMSDVNASDIYSCKFNKDGWKSSDWIYVIRPDLKQDLDEGWIQGENYIENNNPTHTSMVYGKKLEGNLTVSATMSFLDKHAPSIILASKLYENEKGKMEYQEHFEIVLYNKGINIWLHHRRNGKSYWTKTAFWKFRLEKDKKYLMTVSIQKKNLVISVGGREFGYMEENLSDKFFVGITGEEGINRFYNFRIQK